MPTFGSPTSTTVKPVAQQRALPRRGQHAREARRGSRRACPRASAARRKSMSSSGKSSVASVSMRRSISASTSARISSRERARSGCARRRARPSPWRRRSGRPHASACARSSLPLRNARCVNSPGCASRAPSSRQRASSRRSTAGPPWPCSSSTCSPVYECGAGKVEREPLVERLAARVAKRRDGRHARRERLRDERRGNRRHRRAGHADHADAAAARRRRDRGDRVGAAS